MLRCPGLAVREIGDVAVEVRMLITLRYSRSLHHPRGALFHAAIAGHGHVAACAIASRHQLPSRSSAKSAIFKRHVVVAGLHPGESFAKHTSEHPWGQARLCDNCGRVSTN